MFTNDVVEAKRQQIFLQSINARTLKSILGFVYSGEICINQVNIKVFQLLWLNIVFFFFCFPTQGDLL
jgi:hypothetical protein